MQLRIILNSA